MKILFADSEKFTTFDRDTAFSNARFRSTYDGESRVVAAPNLGFNLNIF